MHQQYFLYSFYKLRALSANFARAKNHVENVNSNTGIRLTKGILAAKGHRVPFHQIRESLIHTVSNERTLIIMITSLTVFTVLEIFGFLTHC